MGEPRPRWRQAKLSLVLALSGCYDGQFLALEPCETNRDCGRGMECIDGVCGDYTCPVDEVDGECPCPGRAKYECAELSSARSNKVDILFVVDNTGSIAQGSLVDLAADLRAILDRNLVDYRIAVTTTDVGNPQCVDTSPELGEFVFSSCRERLDDFYFADSDLTDECLGNCQHEVLETVPTTNEGDDDELLARPWLEVRQNGNNLAGDVPVDEALACLIPQGVGGCGFEGQLESSYLALAGVDDPDSPNYGFVRPAAHLLVVIFTNEADCSYNPSYESIFVDDTTFWSDPDLGYPTPAVCWNAGVECLGGPTPYYDCLAVEKDIGGALTLDEDEAVLYPLSRYLEQLEAVRAIKHDSNPELEVFVELIAGVPEGYDGTLVYSSAADSDPEFESEFGVGPGCTPSDLDADTPEVSHAAVPPVRLLAFADQLRPQSGANNVYSYCEQDFSDAFDGISSALDATVPALCMPACVSDEGACELAYRADGASVAIPRCEIDADGPHLGDESLCFYSLSDSAAAAECRAEGWNLQFGFLQADDVDIPETIYASCPPADGCSTSD